MTSKIHLYANLLPYSLRLALSFYPNETIGDIHFFIEETMRRFRVKYKIGRIERKINNVWLLPQYKISEFLKDQEEINVFSLEYGLTKTKIKAPLNEEEIDNGFIGKKTKRRNEDGTTTLGAPTPKSKTSINLNMKMKTPEKEKSDSEEENNNEEEEKEIEESNDDKEEEKSKEDEDEKSEKSEEDEVEEDIAL